MPHSLRWRLPLSYGAVALFAVTILGGILLLTLQGYYARQERLYLLRNAQAIEAIVGPTLDVELAGEAQSLASLLNSQVAVLAFLTQTQIQIHDSDDRLLADSGAPQDHQAVATLSLQLQLEDARQAISQTLNLDEPVQDLSTLLVIEEGSTRLQRETSVRGGIEGLDSLAAPLSLLETPAGFGYAAAGGESLRSTRQLRRPISAPDGQVVGYLELSLGPAFGRAILNSVFWGLLIAAAIAVLLATAVGWLISGRLSRPILALVEVTDQMAGGDLGVRAEVRREDEIGKLAHAFNVMAGRVEVTVAALRHFVADAAHELNTPLTALRTNLDLAARSSPDNQAVDEAQRQAARLTKLSDDLLSLSRLEAGIGRSDFRSHDLALLLANRSELYAAQAEQADLDFDLSLPDGPLWVLGDERYLLRATDNLVDNAVKFTPAGGQVTIAVSADGEWASLAVSDTGIGIAEEERQLLFNRFHRGRDAAAYAGSGLGLAIVKSVAESHQGQVTFESDSHGTRFVIRLPRDQDL